jgi:hypothetical protein
MRSPECASSSTRTFLRALPNCSARWGMMPSMPGSVKIRVETIAHYLEKHSGGIIETKKVCMPPGCRSFREIGAEGGAISGARLSTDREPLPSSPERP